MSFANEEPRIESDWSDFEESAMREDLDTLIDDHAYDFVNIRDGDGRRKPAEILLGGVLQSESSATVDIWITILKIDDKSTTTIRTAHGGYVIDDHRIVSTNNPTIPLVREDMKHIRFWVSEGVAGWDRDHSKRIADKLRLSKKINLGQRLFGRLLDSGN